MHLEQPGHLDVCGASDLARGPHCKQRLRPETAREIRDFLSALKTHTLVWWHRHLCLWQGTFLVSYILLFQVRQRNGRRNKISKLWLFHGLWAFFPTAWLVQCLQWTNQRAWKNIPLLFSSTFQDSSIRCIHFLVMSITSNRIRKKKFGRQANRIITTTIILTCQKLGTKFEQIFLHIFFFHNQYTRRSLTSYTTQKNTEERRGAHSRPCFLTQSGFVGLVFQPASRRKTERQEKGEAILLSFFFLDACADSSQPPWVSEHDWHWHHQLQRTTDWVSGQASEPTARTDDGSHRGFCLVFCTPNGRWKTA